MSGSHNGICHRCELIQSEETGAIKSVVGLESNAEERAIRLHGEVLQLTAVARHFSIHRHVVGHLDIVAGRRRHTSTRKNNISITYTVGYKQSKQQNLPLDGVDVYKRQTLSVCAL